MLNLLTKHLRFLACLGVGLNIIIKVVSNILNGQPNLSIVVPTLNLNHCYLVKVLHIELVTLPNADQHL